MVRCSQFKNEEGIIIYDSLITITYFSVASVVKSRLEKTKPISHPSAGNPKHKALNPKLERERLKKQTQFVPGRIGARHLEKGSYGNNPARRAKKQTQFTSFYLISAHS